MKASAGRYQWMFHLTVACLFGAAVLRLWIEQRHSPGAGVMAVFLTLWMILFIGEEIVSKRQPNYFPYYLILQSLLSLMLLFTAESGDYFAVLFGILSMQIILRTNIKFGTVWIGSFAVLVSLPMIKTYGLLVGIVIALIYAGGIGLLASYALTLRQVQDAYDYNQVLLGQLHDSNRQLQDFARQSQKLVEARERHHLARELHDTVTQIVFAMTLTTRSIVLLLDRESTKVGAQLDRLNQLSQSALSEMQALILQLRPGPLEEGGLVLAIQQHLASRYLPESLNVSLEVEGDFPLDPSDEQGLFRIIQEALNNIVKHARSPQARIRLNLHNPPSVEISDQGLGFDVQHVSNSNGMGLASMRERADEIGWNLRITGSPGAGTLIRIEKKQLGGELS
ncbi:MAG: hypothetical protein CNIPEHKO_03322 [Anaerolineales bacterium]|nr:hypothetical protein [Anaerolineales bacterium]